MTITTATTDTGFVKLGTPGACALTLTVTEHNLTLIANLRSLMLAANSTDEHAFGAVGHLYGDLDVAMRNLLTKITGNTEAARIVGDALIDTYGDRHETAFAIRVGLGVYAHCFDYRVTLVLPADLARLVA